MAHRLIATISVAVVALGFTDAGLEASGGRAVQQPPVATTSTVPSQPVAGTVPGAGLTACAHVYAAAHAHAKVDQVELLEAMAAQCRNVQDVTAAVMPFVPAKNPDQARLLAQKLTTAACLVRIHHTALCDG